MVCYEDSFTLLNNYPEACILQSDIDSIQGRCATNDTKININKSQVLSFPRVKIILIYEYKN
jgi:hypothetical protein